MRCEQCLPSLRASRKDFVVSQKEKIAALLTDVAVSAYNVWRCVNHPVNKCIKLSSHVVTVGSGGWAWSHGVGDSLLNVSWLTRETGIAFLQPQGLRLIQGKVDAEPSDCFCSSDFVEGIKEDKSTGQAKPQLSYLLDV